MPSLYHLGFRRVSPYFSCTVIPILSCFLFLVSHHIVVILLLQRGKGDDGEAGGRDGGGLVDDGGSLGDDVLAKGGDRGGAGNDGMGIGGEGNAGGAVFPESLLFLSAGSRSLSFRTWTMKSPSKTFPVITLKTKQVSILHVSHTFIHSY